MIRDDLVQGIDIKIEKEEAERESKPRPHLGGSLIGDECPRKIWYTYRWVSEVEPFKGRLLRLFRRGQDEEETFIKDLNLLPGMSVHGEQWYETRINGHFAGSIDGVLRDEFADIWFLLEFKTYNDSRFKALKKTGIHNSDPRYYAQVQTYMGFNNLEKALFWAVNKNTDERLCVQIDFDANLYSRILEKAEAIIYAEEVPPRMPGASLSYYKCRFCDFRELCHLGQDSELVVKKVNCRTCSFGVPSLEHESAGKWICRNPATHGKILDTDSQVKACTRWEIINL